MQCETIDYAIIPFECSDDQWNILMEYFALRQNTFIGKKNWDLENFDGIELDEYDKDTSIYIIARARDEGKVVGGARICPTVHPSYVSAIRGDPASFMIADAYAGYLDGLPTDLCTSEPPKGKNIWELTRVVVSEPKIAKGLFQATNEVLAQKGARICLALGSPAVMRIARMLGFNPKPIGPTVGNGSGRFLAFSCDVKITGSPAY